MDEQGRVAKLKLRDNITLDSRGCGCRQSNHWRWTQDGQVVAQGAVVGPKIVAPCTDAVRFVDRNQRGPTSCQAFHKAGNTQPLRCNEQELELSIHVVAAGSL